MTQKTNRPILEVVNSAKKPTGKKPGNTGGSGGNGASKEQRFGDYIIKNGAFYQTKAVKAGPDSSATVEFPLCDFTCRIVEEITSDDGLADATFLRIEGRRINGVPLPLVDVPAKNFYSSQGNWANDHWGTLPFIYPGAAKKDNLRACIHLYSQLNGDVPRRTVFKFTGWKKINDQWHYLTGSGAITADSLIGGVEVDLGAGHMSRYQLPEPLTGEPLKQAVSDALALLDVCPNKPHIGVSLFAAVARAPLGECQPTDFAVWLHGLTGSRKSAIAAIALAFFGNFTARSFPSNWSDSVNDCETKSHQAKDAVFVVDDFKPSVSQAEASKLHAMAERLVRNTGNQAGRGRRDSNMQAKSAPYNRSLMLITAEDLPRGQSLLGRLLILELAGTDVDNNTLTRLQQAAAGGNFTGLMSAYLQWLAPRLDQLKKDFPKNVEVCRDAAIRDGLASSHPRAPEIYANLVAGAETFLEFLESAGAVSSEQSNVLLSLIETGLQQAFGEQGAYQADQDESERFLQLLRAALSSGNAHIACRLKLGPPETRPYAWGWRDAGTDMVGDKNFNPMGDCIGYYAAPKDNTHAEVWLQQDTAFKIVQQFARSQGDAFLLSPASLWRRMHEKGLIVHTEPDAMRNKPRLAVKRTVAGQSKRVMILAADLIESG
ncbi:MAG: cell wall-binding protein [Methylobacter sp.]|uniref:cell wall-binding protein n=1 Tax=Methylobacter sp. TaxID=2051955 RepID=UPI00272F7ACF|nr:cell wall-binding protein [Methylobacter sp.]MDP1665515.1 cell wall-binding protein [Methylobacter sp.]